MWDHRREEAIYWCVSPALGIIVAASSLWLPMLLRQTVRRDNQNDRCQIVCDATLPPRMSGGRGVPSITFRVLQTRRVPESVTRPDDAVGYEGPPVCR